jgi:uncharacterized lipoprotein YddW (UPF0748 family)
MNTRGLLYVGLAVALSIVLPRGISAAGETRARWVDRTEIASVESIGNLLSAAAAGGFDTLLVPAALDADAGAGFDSFGELLRRAHEKGIRIHAWVTIGIAAAGGLPAARDHVIYQHPEWLMLPRALAVEMLTLDSRGPDYLGRLVRWTRANAGAAQGLYLSPAYPDAAAYVAGSLTRLLQRHAVDGVLLDVRIPADDFDYSRRALDAFRAELRPALDLAARARMDLVEAIDPFAYVEEFPEAWQRFRRTRLTGLVARLRHAVKNERPSAVVSAAVAAGAPPNTLQDWRTWMDNGFVDAVTRRDGQVGTILFSYDSLLAQPAQPAGAGGSR